MVTLLHVNKFWVGTEYRLAVAGGNTIDTVTNINKSAHFFSHNCECGLMFIESGFYITGIGSVPVYKNKDINYKFKAFYTFF
jgi:hypothetical protein